MNLRLIGAGSFLLVYLVFLGWYDGWGRAAMTPAEVEQFLSQLEANAEMGEIRERLRGMALADDGEEFFMLNLNRYAYAPGEPQEGVPADYQSYGNDVIGMLLSNAGHPVYSGQFEGGHLVGDAAESGWDEVILVRYRSRRDFISMVSSSEYQRIAQTRAGGIDYAEVSPTRAGLNLMTPRFVVFVMVLVLAGLADALLRRRQTA